MTPAVITVAPNLVFSIPNSIRMIELTGTAVMAKVRPTTSDSTKVRPKSEDTYAPAAKGIANASTETTKALLPASTMSLV